MAFSFLPKLFALSELVGWVKGTATKSDDLTSIPGTHVVEGRTISFWLCSYLHMCAEVYAIFSPKCKKQRQNPLLSNAWGLIIEISETSV